MLGAMDTDLHADYDEGYFDKDEQGWCARRVQVTTDGTRVTIRRSGDDNGARPYDDTSVGSIGTSWPALGLVQIVGERGTMAYFDRNTGRLRSPGEQVSHRFAPPQTYRDPGCLEIVMNLLAPVAAALGMRPGSPPAAPTMPPLVPSLTACDSLESHATSPGEHGCTWGFMLRDFPEGHWLGPQLDVRIAGDGGHVSLFVQEPTRASFLFIGPLELHHLAIAARDEALARWCLPPT